MTVMAERETYISDGVSTLIKILILLSDDIHFPSALDQKSCTLIIALIDTHQFTACTQTLVTPKEVLHAFNPKGGNVLRLFEVSFCSGCFCVWDRRIGAVRV
jgi:hypothetical protein